MKRKIEVTLAIGALACASVVMARETAAYPKEKVAAFVVEKLDVTSLPSAYRPKTVKGKKTLADYGYTVQQLEEKLALVTASNGASKLSITILQQGAAGIYACVAEGLPDGSSPTTQSVVLLKRKDSNAFLKGRASGKEFGSCPVMGGSDEDSAVSSY